MIFDENQIKEAEVKLKEADKNFRKSWDKLIRFLAKNDVSLTQANGGPISPLPLYSKGDVFNKILDRITATLVEKNIIKSEDEQKEKDLARRDKTINFIFKNLIDAWGVYKENKDILKKSPKKIKNIEGKTEKIEKKIEKAVKKSPDRYTKSIFKRSAIRTNDPYDSHVDKQTAKRWEDAFNRDR